MKTKKRAFPVKTLLALLIIALSLTLTFCFSDEETTTTTTTTATTGTTAGSLTLRVSQTSVKSDNSDSATITATVLDTTNAVIEGATVAFSSTGGQFDASSSVTADSSGEAAIGFSAGPERTNQTVTITATVSGLSPKTVPIQITGSTITLTAGNTNLEANDTDTLTLAVKDAGSLPISDASVTASVDASSTGAATVSPSTGTTDINGELDVTVTGTGAGSITVRIQAAGVTATQAYTVSATGNAFGISSPTTDPYSLDTDTDLIITVSAPNQTSVQFATTLGAWDGGADMVLTKAVANSLASATLQSANAGVATVQVFDADAPATTDTLTVAVSAPSSEATQISLQASATVVAPSTGSTSNSVTLEATVNNVNGEPVGSSPVAFSIANPTGGGESISPVISYTDSYGEATTTFTSGSLSSDRQGVTVYANVVVSSPSTTGPSTQIQFDDDNPDTITRADGGNFVTDGFSDGDQIKVSGSISNNGFYTVQTVAATTLTLVASDTLTDEPEGESVTITYAIWDSIPIVIGGTAGSVMIGIGTTITSINSDTAYQAPMSVMVADSNGNPVHGATVSLSLWPTKYAIGFWVQDPDTGECAVSCTYTQGLDIFYNEDLNRNLILDSGEDTGGDPGHGDGQLTPPSSAAGSVPATVTTDENGVASFNMVYLKSSAAWIKAEVTASTLVLGTETQSTYIFWLGWLMGEECSLPHSPYNP